MAAGPRSQSRYRIARSIRAALLRLAAARGIATANAIGALRQRFHRNPMGSQSIRRCRDRPEAQSNIMNDLAQNNLTLGISKNDLAAAASWLTLGSGLIEWGNRRSGLTQATEGRTAHAMCENAVARRSNQSSFRSDQPMHAAVWRRLHRFTRGVQSGRSAADPVLI